MQLHFSLCIVTMGLVIHYYKQVIISLVVEDSSNVGWIVYSLLKFTFP